MLHRPRAMGQYEELVKDESGVRSAKEANEKKS